MAKDIWNRDNTTLLISLYESHRCLWDFTDKDYKNKYKRIDAFSAIASEIGVNNVDEVKKKMASLLIQYRREKRLAKSGDTHEKKRQWWGLEYFQFLNDRTETTMLDNSEPCDSVDIEEGLTMNSSQASTVSSYYRPTTSGSICAKQLKRTHIDDSYDMTKDYFSGAEGRDEHSVYGEHVANRLRKITNRKKLCILKNAIDNLIFAAEMEEYEDAPPN